MIKEYIPEAIKEKFRRIRANILSWDLSKSAIFSQSEQEVMASNDISVIVAIHDSPEITRRCLQSIEKYGRDAEVILVDDGSLLQETVDLIREYEQRNHWIVIRHDEPLGHSRSCEDGGRMASRSYLCFLNSDTVVTPWSWQAAWEAFETDPKIAVTGPSTSWTSTKQKLSRAEYCRLYWDDDQINAFSYKYISKQPPKSWQELPVVGGFAFFIRRSVWDDIGGFNQQLPDYGNESELCKRLLQKRYRLIWTRNSYIHHFGQSSYSRILTIENINKRRFAAKRFIDNLFSKSSGSNNDC